MTLLFYDQFPNNSHSSNSPSVLSFCWLQFKHNKPVCTDEHGNVWVGPLWVHPLSYRSVGSIHQPLPTAGVGHIPGACVVYNLGTNQHVVLINSEMERLGRDGQGWARQRGVSLKITSELQVSGPRFDSLLIDFMMDSLEGCRPRSLSVFGVNGL